MFAKQKEVCNKIEKDKNFGIRLTHQQLIFIAAQTLSSQRQPIVLAHHNPYCDCGSSILYTASQAICKDEHFSAYKFNWSASTTQIMVDINGKVSFYSGEDRELENSLTNLSLGDFLGKSVLITKNQKIAAVKECKGL